MENSQPISLSQIEFDSRQPINLDVYEKNLTEFAQQIAEKKNPAKLSENKLSLTESSNNLIDETDENQIIDLTIQQDTDSLDQQLLDTFKRFADTCYRPNEHQKSKQLRKVRDITAASFLKGDTLETIEENSQAFNMAASEEINEKMSQLVKLSQTIGYLARKKSELQNEIQQARQGVRSLRGEKHELQKIYDQYEFQSHEELMEELNQISQSNDYQENVRNTDHYLVKQVLDMVAKAPGLKRFTKVKEQYRETQLFLKEIEEFYQATCEDLERLRIREKFILDDGFV